MRSIFLIALVCGALGKLFDKPINFGKSVSGNMEQPEKSFPVINIRFQYPPSLTDPRRMLALGRRQADMIDASSRTSGTIQMDVMELMRHISLQTSIATLLLKLPKDLFTKTQKYMLRMLANSIGETTSSVLQLPEEGVEDNPQINIAIEDNTDAFSSSPEMTPSQGGKFITGLSRSWMSNRRLVIEILKVNFKRIELLYSFLKKKLNITADYVKKQRKAGAKANKAKQGRRGSLMQQDIEDDSGEAMIDLDDWYESKNATSAAITSFAGTQIDGLEFPLIMALRGRVMEGGRNAAKALSGLIDLWNEHKGSRAAIRNSMVMMDCNALLMMKKTPDFVKNLAGTLMSLVSGLPVWAAVADFTTGSNAHVNIVIPRPSRVYRADKQIALATGGD